MPQPTEADPTLTGLYAHPVAAALLNEALALLGDGTPADAIEAAATASGMSTGVLALLDAVSLEVVDHALHDELHALEHEHEHHHEAGHEHAHDQGADHAKHQHDHEDAHSHGHAGHACDDPTHKHDRDHGHGHSHAHGHVPDPVPVALPMPTAKAHGHTHSHSHKIKSRQMTEAAVYVVEKMAHGYRRLGRAAGAGFYDYGSDMPQLWSGLKTFERRSRRVPADDVRDRLMFAATLRALSLAPDTTGTAAVAISLGTQIPLDAEAARSLPQLADAARFAARARELTTSYGPRFEPPASLDTTPPQRKA
jgi:hypothetical protein